MHALLSDPGGTSSPGHFDDLVLPSAEITTSAPTVVIISRLYHTACMLPVYASQSRLPVCFFTTTQHSVPAGGHPLPDRIGYLLDSNEKFQQISFVASPFPKLSLAHNRWIFSLLPRMECVERMLCIVSSFLAWKPFPARRCASCIAHRSFKGLRVNTSRSPFFMGRRAGVHPPPPLARRHGMAMESVSSCR